MRHRQLKQRLEQHWHRLYRLAYSWCHDPQLSADLAQDAVAKALSKGHQLRDHQAFDAWLFSILINCWRDTCRQRRDLVDLEQIDLKYHTTPEDELSNASLVQRVRRAVSRLSPEYREIVTLVDLEQLSYKETAEILAIPLGTVMSRLCRARRQLKEILGDFSGHTTDSRVRRIK